MRARRVVISGRVQGVGYRDWLVAEAQRTGVDGWVRNGPDGTVEALFYGETDVMEELLRACRRGPRNAVVSQIKEQWDEPPTEPGFARKP